MFDAEHGTALEAMQVNQASFHCQRGNLMVFLDFRWEPGVSFSVKTEMYFKHSCFSATSGLLSSFQGHLRILLESWQGCRDTSGVEEGDQVSTSC